MLDGWKITCNVTVVCGGTNLHLCFSLSLYCSTNAVANKPLQRGQKARTINCTSSSIKRPNDKLEKLSESAPAPFGEQKHTHTHLQTSLAAPSGCKLSDNHKGGKYLQIGLHREPTGIRSERFAYRLSWHLEEHIHPTDRRLRLARGISHEGLQSHDGVLKVMMITSCRTLFKCILFYEGSLEINIFLSFTISYWLKFYSI